MKSLKFSLQFFMVVLSLSLLSLLIYAQPANTPWPMFQHDSRHTGRGAYNGPENPAILWEFPCPAGYEIPQPPAIGSDGSIYFGCSTDTDGKLYAVNPDGGERWDVPIGWVEGGPLNSSPAVRISHLLSMPGEVIYIGSMGNELDGFYYQNGDKIYTEYFQDQPIKSSPTIADDGTIYVVAGGFLKSIDVTNGINWEFDLSSSAWSSPTVYGRTVYVGTSEGELYAIDTSTGQEKWRYLAGGSIDSAPVVGDDGTIYFGAYDKYLYALDSNGNEKWKFRTGGMIDSSPALGWDGTIYVSSRNGLLYAVNPDGTLKWTFDTVWGAFSPIVDKRRPDGTYVIYVAAFDSLYAINPDGTLKWQIEFPGGALVSTSPVLGEDGTLYLGASGVLFAIGGPGGGGPGNQPPVANAGGSYLGALNSQVILDGSGSSDPDNDPLTYRWTIVTNNSGGSLESGADIPSAANVTVTYTCGPAPGDDIVELEVSDGLATDTDQATISCSETPAVIEGHVCDKNGSPVANATVIIRNQQTGEICATCRPTTDADGYYSAPVPPHSGKYYLSVASVSLNRGESTEYAVISNIQPGETRTADLYTVAAEYSPVEMTEGEDQALTIKIYDPKLVDVPTTNLSLPWPGVMLTIKLGAPNKYHHPIRESFVRSWLPDVGDANIVEVTPDCGALGLSDCDARLVATIPIATTLPLSATVNLRPFAASSGSIQINTIEASEKETHYFAAVDFNTNPEGQGVWGKGIHVELENYPPLANAGPDQTITDTDGDGVEQVTLDGTKSFDPDGTLVNYSWSENSNEIATGASPTVTLSVGTHRISLTVTDDLGAITSDEIVVTVSSSGGSQIIIIVNNIQGGLPCSQLDQPGCLVRFIRRDGKVWTKKTNKDNAAIFDGIPPGEYRYEVYHHGPKEPFDEWEFWGEGPGYSSSEYLTVEPGKYYTKHFTRYLPYAESIEFIEPSTGRQLANYIDDKTRDVQINVNVKNPAPESYASCLDVKVTVWLDVDKRQNWNDFVASSRQCIENHSEYTFAFTFNSIGRRFMSTIYYRAIKVSIIPRGVIEKATDTSSWGAAFQFVHVYTACIKENATIPGWYGWNNKVDISIFTARSMQDQQGLDIFVEITPKLGSNLFIKYLQLLQGIVKITADENFVNQNFKASFIRSLSQGNQLATEDKDAPYFLYFPLKYEHVYQPKVDELFTDYYSKRAIKYVLGRLPKAGVLVGLADLIEEASKLFPRDDVAHIDYWVNEPDQGYVKPSEEQNKIYENSEDTTIFPWIIPNYGIVIKASFLLKDWNRPLRIRIAGNFTLRGSSSADPNKPGQTAEVAFYNELWINGIPSWPWEVRLDPLPEPGSPEDNPNIITVKVHHATIDANAGSGEYNPDAISEIWLYKRFYVNNPLRQDLYIEIDSPFGDIVCANPQDQPVLCDDLRQAIKNFIERGHIILQLDEKVYVDYSSIKVYVLNTDLPISVALKPYYYYNPHLFSPIGGASTLGELLNISWDIAKLAVAVASYAGVLESGGLLLPIIGFAFSSFDLISDVSNWLKHNAGNIWDCSAIKSCTQSFFTITLDPSQYDAVVRGWNPPGEDSPINFIDPKAYRSVVIKVPIQLSQAPNSSPMQFRLSVYYEYADPSIGGIRFIQNSPCHFLISDLNKICAQPKLLYRISFDSSTNEGELQSLALSTAYYSFSGNSFQINADKNSSINSIEIFDAGDTTSGYIALTDFMNTSSRRNPFNLREQYSKIALTVFDIRSTWPNGSARITVPYDGEELAMLDVSAEDLSIMYFRDNAWYIVHDKIIDAINHEITFVISLADLQGTLFALTGPFIGKDGDVNADGLINIKDAELTAQFALDLRIPSEDEEKAADVIQPCSVVDARDVVRIAEVALGLKNESIFTCGRGAGKGLGMSSLVNARKSGKIKFHMPDEKVSHDGRTIIHIFASTACEGIQVGPEGGLSFDPEAIQIKEIRGIPPYQVLASEIDNKAGKAKFMAIAMREPRSGEIIEIEVEPVGQEGESTVIKLVPDMVLDTEGNELEAEVTGGVLTIGKAVPLRVDRVLGAPNPAAEEMTFTAEGQGIKDIQVQVYDLSGRRIFQSDWVENDFAWHLQNNSGQVLANGVYLYIVAVRGFGEDELIKSQVRKLVILR